MMDFATLRIKRQWDRLGKRDPMWAVLTLGDKRGRSWDHDEFFATGRKEIDDIMAGAWGFGLPLRWQTALDFGCGVGRLTQALAQRFASCIGLDIAESMLESARRFNRFPDQCRYVLNRSRRLETIADGSLSFIYSSLVLQHNPPEVSVDYIREFVRALEWGGLLVFQLPSQPFPNEADAAAPRSAAGGPLAPRSMRARLRPSEPDRRLSAGELTAIKARIENCGDATWPCLGTDGGRNQVRLGSHWLSADGEMLKEDGPRADLPRDVPPGDSVDVFLRFTAPAEGEYFLELDLVQEFVAWFSARGSETGHVKMSVSPAPNGESIAPMRPEPRRKVRSVPRAPLETRRPGLHRLLESARLVSGFRAGRGATFRGLKTLEWFGRSQWRRVVQMKAAIFERPPMEMHGVPRSEVAACVASAGGALLWAQECEQTHAGWQSYRYWISRWPWPVDPAENRRALDAKIERIGDARLETGVGGAVEVRLRLTNRGAFEWRSAEPVPVCVGGHALDADGQMVDFDLFRADLPQAVPHGASCEVVAVVPAPPRPGRYRVKVDLVAERVSWFETHGSAPLEIDLVVV